MANRVTIKSIAKDLGISHMTVSRALADSPKVKPETRAAVILRAQELGYVKSGAATAMRGDQTTIVGLLLPNLVNEFYARFADALAKHIDGKGLQLIIHLTNDDPATERRSILKLREIQPRTVAMVPAPETLEDAQRSLEGLHIVQLIRKRTSLPTQASVMVEDTEAISDAVHHLHKQGHRKIGYIGGGQSLSTGSGRLSAFLTGIQTAGLSPLPEHIVTGKPSFTLGYQAAQSLIDGKSVSAIVCGGFEISNGALNACLTNGLQLSRDLSFIGYGDPSYYRWMSGGISTIRVRPEEFAEKTAELIAQQQPSESDNEPHQWLKAELVVR